jgi:DUF1016 N-terminal domain
MMARKQTKSGTTSDRVSAVSPVLIEDIRQIIGEVRRSVATTVNAGLTLLYWRIGKRIVDEVLGKERAAYGQQIVVSVARQLVQEYGPSFGEKNLRRMMQFAEVFPEEEIVVSLIRQLSWTHFIALLPIKNPLQRDFYAELCRVEGWSVSRLRDARGCFATHGGQLAQHRNHRCNNPVTAVPEISEPLCVPPSTI